MRIDITSLCFGFKIEKENDSGTPAWATSIGQAPKGICYVDTEREGLNELVYGMMYKSHSDFENLKVHNIVGLEKKEEPRSDRERMMFSVFEDVYVNGKRVNGIYTLSYERENSDKHKNRLHICYAKYLTYKEHSNKETLLEMAKVLGCNENACWFVTDINVINQSQLHFSAIVVDPNCSMTYANSKIRKQAWNNLIDEAGDDVSDYCKFTSKYVPYITAIKSKPFLLLAGISGTGKSSIVRKLARACWDENSEEREPHKPRNFEMIQVKPNWHDSSELIGYVSKVSGEPRFVIGDFLKFIAKAWMDEDMPYFLCLDEMNLAPVEQYFAEYLSVIETRKKNDNGKIMTDPILKPEYEKERDLQTGALKPKKWYSDLVDELLASCPNESVFALKTQFEDIGITIPQNLIVIGTVNMDETTFSFSRKVLDRAMTIEMNDVDLYGGLEERHESIGKLEKEHLIGTAVEGVDVYSSNKEVCDKVLEYLSVVNGVLEGTPFRVAYRTRNEFLLYVVNNLPYKKDEDGNELDENYVIARALDEITSMKILSRIEGDEVKIGNLLDRMKTAINERLDTLSGKTWAAYEGDGKERSVSLAKLREMEERLKSGYTSFWN